MPVGYFLSPVQAVCWRLGRRWFGRKLCAPLRTKTRGRRLHNPWNRDHEWSNRGIQGAHIWNHHAAHRSGQGPGDPTSTRGHRQTPGVTEPGGRYYQQFKKDSLGLRPPVFLKLSALLSAPPATQNGHFLRVFFDFQARPSHKVATFMKTRGTFSPARQKLI